MIDEVSPSGELLAHRGHLRRSYVVGPGSGRPYPAFLRTPVRKGGLGYVRPFFTGRTVRRILSECERELESATEAPVVPEDSGVPAELIGAVWQGRTLVLNATKGGRQVRIQPLPSGLYPLLTRDHWWEVRPCWPRRFKDAKHLTRLLETPTTNVIPLLIAIQATVPTSLLVDARALASGSGQIQGVVIGLLAERPEPHASESIAGHLVDRSRVVRAAAAHAFEHRGAGVWALSLLGAAKAERDEEVLELQIRALATVAELDRPAVMAWLLKLRRSETTSPNVRRAIRYGLDILGNRSAHDPDFEDDVYRPGMIIGLTHGPRRSRSDR